MDTDRTLTDLPRTDMAILQRDGLAWHLARTAQVIDTDIRVTLMCAPPGWTGGVAVAEAIYLPILAERRPGARLCPDCRAAYLRARARGLTGALTAALTEGVLLDEATIADLVVLQGSLAVAVG